MSEEPKSYGGLVISRKDDQGLFIRVGDVLIHVSVRRRKGITAVRVVCDPAKVEVWREERGPRPANAPVIEQDEPGVGLCVACSEKGQYQCPRHSPLGGFRPEGQ